MKNDGDTTKPAKGLLRAANPSGKFFDWGFALRGINRIGA